MSNSNTEKTSDYQRYTNKLKSTMSIIDYQISELQVISNTDLIKTPSLTRQINHLTKELTDFRSYLSLRLATAELKQCLTERKPLNKKSRRIA